MINLIPPAAKKKIVMEYRLRVISVWFYLWSGALAVGIFIMIPTYTLITLQVSAYEASSEVASKKIADYESVSKELVYSSQQAKKLVEGFSITPMSRYIALFRRMENNDIALSQIVIQRSDEKTNTVQLVGEANTASHSALKPPAMRRAARTSLAELGPGPTQTSRRSAVGQIASGS